jgi:hypothetical protein
MNFATGQEKYIFIIKKLSSFFLFIFKVGRGEVVTLVLLIAVFAGYFAYEILTSKPAAEWQEVSDGSDIMIYQFHDSAGKQLMNTGTLTKDDLTVILSHTGILLTHQKDSSNIR